MLNVFELRRKQIKLNLLFHTVGYKQYSENCSYIHFLHFFFLHQIIKFNFLITFPIAHGMQFPIKKPFNFLFLISSNTKIEKKIKRSLR